MLVIANDGVCGARRALSHRSCKDSSAVPFCRVIAPANHTYERLVPWCCIVARHCNACPHVLQVMIALPTHMSCRRLGNTRACLGNTGALLHAIAAKPFFITMTHGPRRAMGHVSAPELTSEAGAVRSRGMHVSAGALLGGKEGSGAEGCVAAPKPA
jgi:hypothetical protein